MNNRIEHWKTYIETELMKPNVVFGDLYKILIEMKENEVDREAAYTLLTEIRNTDKVKSVESKEDLVLEMIDIVVGCCPPHLRIW